MKSIRWASATTLAIALFGCGGGSNPPQDTSVGPLDTGGSSADSGGAVSDTASADSSADSSASSLDSGLGDTVVVEGGIPDGGGEGSIPAGPDGALDLATRRWMLPRTCWQVKPGARMAGRWMRPSLKVALTLA